MAYTAGIIDGEGCIGIYQQTSKTSKHGFIYSMEVNVKSVDEWLPMWLKFAFGGSISTYTSQAGNCMWSWTVSYNKALVLLQSIVPYLQLKRPQAELAIRFQLNRHKAHHMGKVKTDKEMALEEVQAILLKNMKDIKYRQEHNSNLKLEVNRT